MKCFLVLSLLALSACSEQQRHNSEDGSFKSNQEHDDTKKDTRPLSIGYKIDERYGENVEVLDDKDGCQYIALYSTGRAGIALTPRLGKDGKPICNEETTNER